MKAIIYLKECIGGYWDGGKKRIFTVELDRKLNGELNIMEDLKGKFIKVHCFSANRWYNVSLGKSERQTLSYAIKRIITKKNRHLLEKIEFIKE